MVPKVARAGIIAEPRVGALARTLIGLVEEYQRSDWRARREPRCGFIPSCSEYAIRALRQHGAVKGSVLTVGRFCRCNPRYGGPRVDFP